MLAALKIIDFWCIAPVRIRFPNASLPDSSEKLSSTIPRRAGNYAYVPHQKGRIVVFTQDSLAQGVMCHYTGNRVQDKPKRDFNHIVKSGFIPSERHNPALGLV